MMHELFSTKDRDKYKDRVTLTFNLVHNAKGLYTVGFVAGMAYTNSTKVLTLPAGVFGGYSSIGWDDCSDIPVGSLVIIRQEAGGADPFVTRVASVTDTTHIVLEDAYGSNLTSDFDVCILGNWVDFSSESIYIGGETWYKGLDQILSMYESGTAKECVNAETLSNFRGMKKKQMAYSYKNTIIYVRDSEYLHFAKGSGVSSYGTITMYYTRKPYALTQDSDLIDLPDSSLDILYKLCMLQGLQTLQVPIPVELQSANALIMGHMKSKDSEINSLLTNKGDN